MSSVCVLMSDVFLMCHSSTKDVELRLNVGLTERKGLFAAPLSDWRVSLTCLWTYTEVSAFYLSDKDMNSDYCELNQGLVLLLVGFFCFFLRGHTYPDQFFWTYQSTDHNKSAKLLSLHLKPLYSKWCKWQQALFNSSLREGWFRNDKQSAHLRSTVYLRFVSMTTVEGFEATLKKNYCFFFFFCHTSSASALSALPVLYLCWDRKVECCPRALDFSILGLFHLIKCIYILHEDEEKWSQLWNCNPESVGLTWTLFCAHSTLEDTPQQPPPFLLSLLHLLPLSLSLFLSLQAQSVCSIIISMVTIKDVKLSLMYYSSNLCLFSPITSVFCSGDLLLLLSPSTSTL